MKDEIKIKQLLDRLLIYRGNAELNKWQPEDILTIEDVWLLLDYITNLQQKYEGAILIGKELNKDNERANQYIDFYEDLTKQQINMINDYKSRNKKAVEYIKNNCYYLVDNDDKNLLNILNGDDNE